MKKYYTGVGSRKIPAKLRPLIFKISSFLESKGFILRTGDATGSDKFFRDSVKSSLNKEIYTANDATPRSIEMASKIHPAWNRCDEYSKKLHGRNCFQVLGKDLKTPSLFLICWTENGEVKGGTATAINLALKNNIPVFNLGKGDEEIERFREYLKNILN